MKDFGTITQALTSLLKGNGKFQWNERANQAFQQLKRVLVIAPVLTLPNFSLDFVIETNAFGVGISAVLMQKGHPIAFISKALSPKHQALSVYDKEMLGILFVVKK